VKTKLQSLRVGIAALGAMTAGWAMAQENPYYLGAALGMTHESNLFRVATGQPETSDTFTTTSLLAGVNQPFGRQRFYADAAMRHNRYRDNDQLNNTGYGLSVGLDWETIERLSGKVNYLRNRALARAGADQGPALTTKNEETGQEFGASVRYGLASLLSLEAALKHRQLDYSAVEFNSLELKEDSLELGIQRSLSGLLSLGGSVRYSQGKYPFSVQTAPGAFQADDFDRKDLNFTATWVPTGLSTIRGRLSYTKESHQVVGSRDVSGVTGAVSWDYKPTAKLAFTTDLIRDTGAEAAFASATAGGGGQTGNSSQLSSIVQLRALYEATAKIQVEANARYIRRDLVTTFGLNTGASSVDEGSDRYGQLRLGFGYAPVRNALVGCSVSHEKRGSSSAASYSYRANVGNCYVQFKLQ